MTRTLWARAVRSQAVFRSPQALQTALPFTSLRQSGVSEVWQTAHWFAPLTGS